MVHDRHEDSEGPGTPDPLLGSIFARRLLALARARPGLGVREATRALHASWGTVSHHCRRLERQGFLRSRLEERRRVFYPEAQPLGAAMSACHAMLQGATMRRIAAFVQVNAPTGRDEVARRLDLPPNAARHHLERLLSAGLLSAGVPSRLDDLQPTPLLDLLLCEPPAEGEPGVGVALLRERDDASAP